MTGHQQARVKGTAEPISRRGWARENIDGLHRFHRTRSSGSLARRKKKSMTPGDTHLYLEDILNTLSASAHQTVADTSPLGSEEPRE